ncbi:MAG: 50S ribosomal protein L25 [Caldilineaceae bacterium]|nr:50S ribosomal protein L25 [Caldilineaceae bacterium]
MSDLTLQAQPREITGRKVRQLRVEGFVPVVVYGKNQDSVNLQVTARNLERVLHAGGMSQLVTIDLAGSMQNVLVREVQRHPVSHRPLHADLYAVDMTQKQSVTVPVVALGEPEALTAGFMVLQPMDQIEIEALPADIPAHIEVDISSLDVDSPITIANLPAIEGVTYSADEDEAIFTLNAIRIEEEEEDEKDELDLDAESVEPEVVGRAARTRTKRTHRLRHLR